MKKVKVRVPSLAKKYPRVVATPCKDHNLPPEAEELAKKIEDKLSQMTAMAVKAMVGRGKTPDSFHIDVEEVKEVILHKLIKEEVAKVLKESVDGVCPKGYYIDGKSGDCRSMVSMGFVIPAGAVAQVAARYAQAIRSKEALAIPVAALARKIEYWFRNNDKVAPEDSETSRDPEAKVKPNPLTPAEEKDLYRDLGIDKIMKIDPTADQDEKEEEEPNRTWYLFPGGFKPPHAGHYYMAMAGFNIDWADQLGIPANGPTKNKRLVLIGAKSRDGHNSVQSKVIWNHYIQNSPSLVSSKVEAIEAEVSPIKWIFDAISNKKIMAGDRLYIINSVRYNSIDLDTIMRLNKHAKLNGIEIGWVDPFGQLRLAQLRKILLDKGWATSGQNLSGTELRGLIKQYRRGLTSVRSRINEFIPTNGTINKETVFKMMIS